jgi:hypothetical protein
MNSTAYDLPAISKLLDLIGAERSEDNDRALLRVRDRAIVALRTAREMMADVDAAIIDYMTLNQCDLQISDTERLYVGTTRVTKSIDDQEILMAILEAGNGNMELLTTGAGGMLGSQPWKSGAVRALIGDAMFNKLFVTETKLDLKTGKPAKSVKVADSRFGPKE